MNINKAGDIFRLGSCEDVLAEYSDEYFSSVVTDPPYGISFMGRGWDIQVPKAEIWREVYRVLKPGGFMLVCCGTRTYHHMTMRVEEAGFQIRDMIVWIYATGFPKSQDISKAFDKGVTAPTSEAKKWDGWGTALKPAAELWAVCRKPLSEDTVVKNIRKHGTGGINIDASRIRSSEPIFNRARSPKAAKSKGIYGDAQTQEIHQTTGQKLGRWPANVILGHHPDCRLVGLKKVKAAEGGMTKSMGGKGAKGIYGGGKPTYRHSHGAEDGYETVDEWECTPDCPVELLDTQGEERGIHSSGSARAGGPALQKSSGGMFGIGVHEGNSARYGDDGGASRFFYQAKADNKERWFFCDKCITITNKRLEHDAHPESLHYHLTQKPVELMRHLVKLVTPPDGIVLDPFVGSGSTCIGAKLEGILSIGIERDPIHFGICRVRYRHAGQEPLQERPFSGLKF